MEELKKKIDEAMKCQFVGEVIFTEDELAKIYARANSLLRNYDYGYISCDKSLARRRRPILDVYRKNFAWD